MGQYWIFKCTHITYRGIGLLWQTHYFFKGDSVVLTLLCLFSPSQDAGLAVYDILRELETQCLTEISAMLNGEIPGDELGDLFFDCVDTEIKFYQWYGSRLWELKILCCMFILSRNLNCDIIHVLIEIYSSVDVWFLKFSPEPNGC